jgi:hypothetical protein
VSLSQNRGIDQPHHHALEFVGTGKYNGSSPVAKSGANCVPDMTMSKSGNEQG